MGIVEFLEARIAEDEAVAQDAGARAMEWRSSNGSVAGGGKPYVDDWSEDEPLTQYDGEVTIVYDEGWPEDVEAEHIARQDPARILREVAAKRAIIFQSVAADDYYAHMKFFRLPTSLASGACGATGQAIQALASAYSSHPDYQKEWAL